MTPSYLTCENANLAILAVYLRTFGNHWSVWRNMKHCCSLGPFYGAIAVPSDTCCHCCRRCCCCGHRCAGGMRQWRHASVATRGEWQCDVQRLAVANGPNIFQMLLVWLFGYFGYLKKYWQIFLRCLII